MIDLQATSIPSTAWLPTGPSEDDRRTSYTPMVTFGREVSLAAPSETATDAIELVRRTERSHTLNELQEHPVFGRLWQVPSQAPELQNPLNTARDQRLAILARQFEGAVLTREDEARVAILTQRLRRLAPRVTQKSWTIAEESLAQLEAVSARIDEISAKYGL